MGRFEDLTGRTFGKLTVISRAPNNGKKTMWHCRCSCKSGKVVTVRACDLKSGHAQSCGCLGKERRLAANATHGMTHTRIHKTWCDIKQRCTNPNHKFYKHYGGRGIKLFEEWLEFEPFYEYVSKLEHFEEAGYTLDRINNDGDYEPGNVRWADRKTQMRNTRKNVFVEYQGETMTLAEASEKSGVNRVTLKSRIEAGDTGDYLFRPAK